MSKINIEVGEYVRTKIGYILKVTEIKKTSYGCCGITDNEHISTFTIGKGGNAEIKIKKHSPNIIDLIEVGDYVNGEKIQFINRGNLITEGGYDLLKKYNEITAIVTKEQFRNIEYKAKNR